MFVIDPLSFRGCNTVYTLIRHNGYSWLNLHILMDLGTNCWVLKKIVTLNLSSECVSILDTET